MTFERRHDDQHQHRRRRQCFDESDKNLTATLGPDYGPGQQQQQQQPASPVYTGPVYAGRRIIKLVNLRTSRHGRDRYPPQPWSLASLGGRQNGSGR